ncbi:MAG: molybdate ABC transporter substrate-binding protein [Dehalococcoidia bacterium]
MLLALALPVALVGTSCGGGDGHTVFAASSLTDLMPDLIEAYRDAGGEGHFELSFGGSQTLAAQVIEGAPAELFIAANEETAARVVEAGHRLREAPLWRNHLVIAVRADSDIDAIEALAAPGVRIAVGAPDVPVGALTNRVLDLLAEADPATVEAIRANVVTEDTNVRVALSRVELGEADAAFVYRTDIEAAANEDVRAIELPPGMPATQYVAVLLTGASAETESLFDFFANHRFDNLVREAGFDVSPSVTPTPTP